MADIPSRQDLVEQIEDLQRRLDDLESAASLPSSSVGSGGLSILNGGTVTIEGGRLVIEDDDGNEAIFAEAGALTVSDGRLVILDGDGNEAIFGEAGTFTIDDGRLVILDAAGAEAIVGEAGAFTIDDGRLVILDAAGNEAIVGEAGALTVQGGGALTVKGDTTMRIVPDDPFGSSFLTGGWLEWHTDGGSYDEDGGLGGIGVFATEPATLTIAGPLEDGFGETLRSQVILHNQSEGLITLNAIVAVQPGDDNTTGLGRSSRRWTEVWAVDGTINTSDAATKDDVADDDLGTEFILGLRPRRWKRDGRVGHGFVAQEVAQAVPDGLDFDGVVDDDDGLMGLRYHEFIGPLVATVQAQQEQIERLTARLESAERKRTG